MQQDEIEELRAARAREERELRELRQTEMEEICAFREQEMSEVRRRRRDEDARYHDLVRTLLRAQQQMVTVANTQGLEVPEIRDLSLHTISPTQSSRATVDKVERQGISTGKEVPLASEDSLKPTEEPTATTGGSVSTDQDPPLVQETVWFGPDASTRLESAKLPPLGTDAQDFIRQKGPFTQEDADRLSRSMRVTSRRTRRTPRGRGFESEDPPVLVELLEEPTTGTVAAGGNPGDPSDSSDGSDDQRRNGGDPDRWDNQNRRGMRRHNHDSTDSDEEGREPSASRLSRAHTGFQSVGPRGENPRYLRPISMGQDVTGGHSMRRLQEDVAPEPYAYQNGLRAWIEEVLVQDLDFEPDNMRTLNRSIKIKMPGTYEGQDDVEVFCDWVMEIT